MMLGELVSLQCLMPTQWSMGTVRMRGVLENMGYVTKKSMTSKARAMDGTVRSERERGRESEKRKTVILVNAATFLKIKKRK